MKSNKLSFFFIVVVVNLFLSNRAYGQLTPVIGSIQGPSAVCSQPATPATFFASATNFPAFYSWTYAGPAGAVIINSPSSSVTTISFPFPNLNTTYTLYCNATNAAGTSATSSFVVSVFETPTVTFSGATSFCQGSSTNLSASPTIISASSTLSYTWNPSLGLSNTSGSDITAQPFTTTTYTLLLALGNCTNSAQITVNVVNCAVGIPQQGTSLHKSDIALYPNPNSGTFFIESHQDELALILNEIGQTVRSLKLISGQKTKITGLPEGIYFIVTPGARKKVVITP